MKKKIFGMKLEKMALIGVASVLVFTYVVLPFTPHSLWYPPLDSDTLEMYTNWTTEYIDNGDDVNSKILIDGLTESTDTRSLKIYYEQKFGDVIW